MTLFARNKELGVQSFIMKLVNNNCPELKALIEGPRADRRVNLMVVVKVIPVRKGRLIVPEAFNAVTKEFSGAGVGVVIDKPQGPQEAVIAFHFDGETLDLPQDGPGGVHVQCGKRLVAEMVLEPAHLEQIELNVPQVGLVVRHDVPLSRRAPRETMDMI